MGSFTSPSPASESSHAIFVCLASSYGCLFLGWRQAVLLLIRGLNETQRMGADLLPSSGGAA